MVLTTACRTAGRDPAAGADTEGNLTFVDYAPAGSLGYTGPIVYEAIRGLRVVSGMAGLGIGTIDGQARHLRIVGAPADRWVSLQIVEDGQSAHGLQCNDLPKRARVDGYSISFQVGIAAKAGRMNLQCATVRGPFTVEINYEASSKVQVSAVPTPRWGGESLVSGSVISGDGHWVAWTEHAATVSANSQVIARNLDTGARVLVSATEGGSDANDRSWDASLSADGKYAVFSSVATNLVAGVTGRQIYSKNLVTGEVKLVSAVEGSFAVAPPTTGNAAVGEPRGGEISADGTVVLFWRSSANDGDQTAIYAKNLLTGKLSAVNVDKDGAALNGILYLPRPSRDGRYAVFYCAMGACAGTVYRKDLLTGDLLSVNRSAALAATSAASGAGDEGSGELADLSDDGRFVSYISTKAGGAATLVRRDLEQGSVCVGNLTADGKRNIEIETHSTNFVPELSGSGRFLVFHSARTNGAAPQLYRKDCDTGELLLVSGEGATPSAPARGSAVLGSLDQTGQWVTFIGDRSDLGAIDSVGTLVYRKDCKSGRIWIANAWGPSAVAFLRPADSADRATGLKLSLDGEKAYFAWAQPPTNQPNLADCLKSPGALLQRELTSGDLSCAVPPAGAATQSADGKFEISEGPAFGVLDQIDVPVPQIFVAQK